ncbi:type I-E CRISPR-associated protein Cse2/CasB [Streptomyces monomycini]|uniref:type I-E CRISPR-associated protein Cse2/CasB n=1 Tax=Streptomyces monomycini TaxID=371720 RepID=UPI0007C521C1|nr:type I-E CRISPR-associated protein Cse2/CasB [Streptomyces monomycini]
MATARCIGRLQNLYRQDVPAAVAILAQLRRAAGRTVHETPDIWGIDGLEDLARVWEEHRQAGETDPAGGEASPELLHQDVRRKRETSTQAEEDAVHVAVTLWALHQQSIRDAAMHEPGWGLGRAVRALAQGGRGTAPAADEPEAGRQETRSAPRLDDELNETLRKRFVRIGTSTSFDMLAVRLREVVQLLRTARIPLDYARLADQLCRWQNENLRADVRRAWGRDLHLSYGRQTRPGGEDENDAEDTSPLSESDGPDPGL